MFKSRFWLSLILSIPVVFFSPMVAHLLGYTIPEFPGAGWIAPILGTVVFIYGGDPFLRGGWAELKARQPGMMLLISMAITAFMLSLAYRQYRYRTEDFIQDDVEDVALSVRRSIASAAPDHDASDDPETGRMTSEGDEFGPESFEQPLKGEKDD